MAFTELGCMQEINRAVDEMGWLLPTDIQAESIPLILGGGDVLMAAETGSGKTGAFSIPVVQIIHEAKLAKGGKIPSATGGGDATGSSGTSSGIVEMNAFDRDPELALQGSLAQSRHFKNWNGCRASHGVTGNEGRYCYEVTCTDQGLSRIGFASDLNAKLNLGTCPNGFGFGGTGKKSNNYNFDDFGEAYGQHDVMGVCLDLSKSQIKGRDNENFQPIRNYGIHTLRRKIFFRKDGAIFSFIKFTTFERGVIPESRFFDHFWLQIRFTHV